MEERQLHERHQLAKRQLKDLFFLQRHQMLVHHEKELEHLKRMMDRKEEDLIKNQTLERKALPKRISDDSQHFNFRLRPLKSSAKDLQPKIERDAYLRY